LATIGEFSPLIRENGDENDDDETANFVVFAFVAAAVAVGRKYATATKQVEGQKSAAIVISQQIIHTEITPIQF
jgi:hypothetical protein